MSSLTNIRASVCLSLTLLFCGCQKTTPTTTQTPPPPPDTSSHGGGGHDSDVGIGGGAVTFYLRHGDWSPKIGTPATSYCATVGDLSIAYLYGFENTPPDPLFKNQASWKMRIHTSKTFLDMQGGTDLCGPRTGAGVRISLDEAARQRPGIGFYSTELDSKQHNRRFHDTADAACRQDEDNCERMTSVDYNGATYKCDTQNCWIYIGNSKSKTLTVESPRP